ncbi:NLR family CARD domain-containing protein 3-like [Astatotilapia calliptera]|uniref:NLR family CARD domain-containing protein 3-like n=1 Tax=Astatotilapia calliptera TaxID=8154 RepID=UPI000E401D67|nr:NLR family CARD domain-containing protein 3-like [Astatotilapia calliptera]
MDQCEDREEGVPPSKSTLCGEHESQTKAQRIRPAGPGPNLVSYDSKNSKFEERQPGLKKLNQEFRPKSDPPRYLRLNKDKVKDAINKFEQINGEKKIHQRFKPEPALETGPGTQQGSIPLKSDWCKRASTDFKGQQDSAAERIHEIPAGPESELGPESGVRDGAGGQSAPEPICLLLKNDGPDSGSSDCKVHHASSAERNQPGPPPSSVSLQSVGAETGSTDCEGQQGSPAERIGGSPAGPGPGAKAGVEYLPGSGAGCAAEAKFEPETSSLSLKSDWSKEPPLKFNNQYTSALERVDQESSEVHSGQSAQQHQTQLDSIFMLLEDNIIDFVKNELKKIQKVLSPDYPECLESHRSSTREAFVKITVDFLRRMKQEELADHLQSRVCQREFKSNLKKKFQCVFEGIAEAGNPTLLNQIYTELYITEGGTAEVNDEHEVRQIETASRKPDSLECTIRQEDIFKASPGRDEPIRTVLTKGVAGIGKTVLTQKYTLDWAEDKANQHIQFIFPFTFRELNVLKEEKFSLVGLVHHFFTETKEAEICSFEGFQVVFIFDGLDECRLPLDFHKTTILTDPRKSTSVDVLLINLIRGKLLPSACLWITTRPAAANQIPPDCVDMVTEVRGFTDPQKEEYFRKRFRDEEQASSIISHIKTSRSLHIMCHIPVFCWITATVLEDVLETREGGELPKTLTEMYIHFLVVQAKVKKVKYDGGAETDPHWSPESRKMIESLGKLAFDQLQKGNLIFYESDLSECGIDITAASVCSGVFTQIFKEERGLYQDKVFCFIHLSVQEFLAALHVHLTFINSGLNLLEEKQPAFMFKLFRKKESRQTELTEKNFYQSAVDKALQNQNGHLDLFLRFLLGLSLVTNQTLLRGLLTQTGSSSPANQETVQYIKEKLSENLSAEKSISLLHCLNELNDRSLVEEIQQSLRSGSFSTDKLSPAQWSALVFILLSSDKDLDVFDLKKYSASEEALLRLLPVVKASNKAELSGCNLSERSCEALSSVLSSQSSSLRELNLSNNNLQDLGVKLLSIGLENPHCKLETLRLNGCNLSDRSCECLSSVLISQPSSLRDLGLNDNDLHDSGVNLLSAGVKSPFCKLETLSLSGCVIAEDSCTSLASALNSNPSHLRELDLSYNHPGESGIKLLLAGLKDPQWRLEILRVEPAGVRWLRPGLRKYSCQLTIDKNTVHTNLQLSDNNRKVTHVKEVQSYPDHPDRFDVCQLLCRNSLTCRCYWEVEWRGDVCISVSYRNIGRKGGSDNCVFGGNDQSWSLICTDDGPHSVYHNDRETSISSSSSSVSNRVAVYVDCPAGTLSFYRVSSDTLIHLHTFNTTFTQPLYPGFLVESGSSVTLC